MSTHSATGDSSGSWKELFGRGHRGAAVILAGGVALYATNVFLTTSLLPDAVSDIGGQQFYAWVTTSFLLASVISSVLVSATLSRLGARGSYFLALAGFAVGTIACGLAPSMEVMLAGRFVQGLGGGLLTGLSYALIRSMFPEPLWPKGTALVSAMWGVGTFVGPAVGGTFAQFQLWRGAFVALVLVTALMAVAVPFIISATRSGDVPPAVSPVTVVLLVAAVLLVSLSNIVESTAALTALIVGALLVLALALGNDRRRGGQILPRSAFSWSSPLPWCYAAIALLSIASQIEGFVPLFAQRLGMLAPLLAGFVGAAIALGWTLGEIPSAGVTRPRAKSVVATLGPVLIVVGFVTSGLLTASGALNTGTTIAWVLALLVGGAGIGMAWPHVATRVMGGIADGEDGDAAAAAINTTQLVANAIGSAVAGVLVHLGRPEAATQSATMFVGISVAGLLGIWCVWRGTAAWRAENTPAADLDRNRAHHTS